MKRAYKPILVLSLVLILFVSVGFAAASFSDESTFCTEMGCPCQGVEGERKCNSCTSSECVFLTGVINIKEICRANEVITCENNTQVNSRIDWDNKDCSTKTTLFGFDLNSRRNQKSVSYSTE